MAFTATQIPGIEDRIYPTGAGRGPLPGGHPDRGRGAASSSSSATTRSTRSSSRTPTSRTRHVMHIGSRALAAGADYTLLGPQSTTMIDDRARSSPCARCGPAPASRRPPEPWPRSSRMPASRWRVIRHPMPYGDLASRSGSVSRRYADLDRSTTRTIEEREEYEHASRAGLDRLRRRRLPGDPGTGRARSRRDPVGRRQQRPSVLRAGRSHHGRRSAAASDTRSPTTRAKRTSGWPTSSSSTRSTRPKPGDVDDVEGHDLVGEPERDDRRGGVPGDARRRRRPAGEEGARGRGRTHAHPRRDGLRRRRGGRPRQAGASL